MDPNKIDLSDLNKAEKQSKFKRIKSSNYFRKKKPIAPNRDHLGQFTSGSGGLKSFKKFNWGRVIPVVAIVALVGGYLVYRSFAGTQSCPGNLPTQASIESCLTTSNESKIARLYYAAFGRTPDKDGLRYWVSQLDSGKSLNSVARSFLGTPESRAIYGTNPTHQQFINKLYPNVLGRAPSSTEVNYWVGELTNNRKTREAVVIGFSESPEMKNSFKTQVAKALSININRLGTHRRTYSGMNCYGTVKTVKGRRSCTMNSEDHVNGFNSGQSYIIGGANWGFSLPGGFRGKSVTLCYDIQSGPTEHNSSNGTTDVKVGASSAHSTIQARPSGNILAGWHYENTMQFSAASVKNFRTVCSDMTDLAGNETGWYIRVGYTNPKAPWASNLGGQLAVAMDNIHVYTIDEDRASARNQNQNILEASPADNSHSFSSAGIFPKPYNRDPYNAQIYLAKGSSSVVYSASATDPQPVWRSSHDAYAGENNITPLGIATDKGATVEYIVKNEHGMRIPIDRFAEVDPVTNREIWTLPTEPGNPSKVIIPRTTHDQLPRPRYIYPIFNRVFPGDVTIEIKVHQTNPSSSKISLRDGIRVERYQFVGNSFSLRYPKVQDSARLIQEINDYIARNYPNSPMRGMGNRFVSGGYRADVNPLLAVAQARHESGFGTAGVATIGTHNAFGRTANPGQPYIKGTERNWYKWENWQKSLLADACPASGSVDQPDDWFQYVDRVFASQLDNNDLDAFVNAYAPAFENDVPAYINAVLSAAYEISYVSDGAVDLTRLGTPGSCGS